MTPAAPDECTTDDLRAMASRLIEAGLVSSLTEGFSQTPVALRLSKLDARAWRERAERAEVARDQWKGVAMRREKLHDELVALERAYDKAVAQLESEMDRRIAAEAELRRLRGGK